MEILIWLSCLFLLREVFERKFKKFQNKNNEKNMWTKNRSKNHYLYFPVMSKNNESDHKSHQYNCLNKKSHNSSMLKTRSWRKNKWWIILEKYNFSFTTQLNILLLKQYNTDISGITRKNDNILKMDRKFFNQSYIVYFI